MQATSMLTLDLPDKDRRIKQPTMCAWAITLSEAAIHKADQPPLSLG